MPRDAVSRTANVEHTARHKWVNANKTCIAITVFRLIRHETEFRLMSNQSGNYNSNRNLVRIIEIEKSFPCLETWLGLHHSCLRWVWIASLLDSNEYVTRPGKAYTQRKLFEILLNQTEIKLYLPCTD